MVYLELPQAFAMIIFSTCCKRTRALSYGPLVLDDCLAFSGHSKNLLLEERMTEDTNNNQLNRCHKLGPVLEEVARIAREIGPEANTAQLDT